MSSTALSSTEAYSLLSLCLAAVGVLLNTFTGEGEPLVASIAFSCLAFASCYALIRWLGNAFIRRGFKGKDLCKLKQTEMYDRRGLPDCRCSLHDVAQRPWAPCAPWSISSPSSPSSRGLSTKTLLWQRQVVVIAMSLKS